MTTLRVSSFVAAAALATMSVAQQSLEPPVGNCQPGKYEFKGSVTRGQTFSRTFDGFVFRLVPIDYGWMIDISQGTQRYLDAGMTGPRHGPNPIEIEGWHFRNAANTGPNRGEVNAPDETRRFLFSPRWPHCEDAVGLDKDGQGILEIADMDLGNLTEGEKANITRMEFSVVLTVGPSACTACPPPVLRHDVLPGEGWSLGVWKLIGPAPIFDTWSQGRKQIARLSVGDEVTALEGLSVVIKPDVIVATSFIEDMHLDAGDTLLRYTYLGEGNADFWAKGRWYSDFDGSFVRESDGGGCQNRCKARVVENGEKVWWFRVRIPDGRIGWTNARNSVGQPYSQ